MAILGESVRGARTASTALAPLRTATTGIAGQAHGRAIFGPPNLPPYAGNIPFGALSVRVTVTNPTTGAELAPQRIVGRPANNGSLEPLVNIQYAALPVGPVKVDVQAYRGLAGSGSLLATGSAAGQISALQLTTLTAPMKLTITHVTVNPNHLALGTDGDRGTFTAQALDANDNPIDMLIFYLSADPDIANVMISPIDPMSAIVTTGQPPGLTEIIAYEPNSGLFATVTVDTGG
jgi:hypothetical protein